MDTTEKKKIEKGYLIAAATSNSGKTTFTMGLLRALRNRGLKVQPFKCGPDYIDPMFHKMASGRESVNLDTFMSSAEHVRQLFLHYGKDADVCIVEGVMGLFDGYDKSRGSSAEIAMLLDIPVILIVSAKSVAYSVAPLIYGFKHFNPDLRLAGVVFNMVASESHYSYLKSACEDAGVPCLGYMLRNEQLVIPGRHLGLTIQAKEEVEQIIELAAKSVAPLIPLKGGSRKTSGIIASSPLVGTEGDLRTEVGFGAFSFLVACDEAFNFTYRANIDALRRQGKVHFFSPLHDKVLPITHHPSSSSSPLGRTEGGVVILYLPGGYPELFAEQLAANESMRRSIKEFAEQGGRIFAECGGFMYLCHDIDGIRMCDVLPFHATMQGARLHLGYRTSCQHPTSSPLGGNEGDSPFRGHEFHYSTIIEPDVMPDTIIVERIQQNAKGQSVPASIYHYKNVTAGYTHWYWAEAFSFHLFG